MDETLSPEERQQVEEAAEYVGGLLAREKKVALDTALEIGGYLLDNFYEGSEDLYRTHQQGTPALHALVDRLELGTNAIGLRQLHNYIVVAIQDRRWGYHIEKGRMEESVRQLNLTSRAHLTRCRNVNDEIRIAEEAVDESLSTRQVLERVQEANATGPIASRPERDHEAITAAINVSRAIGELEDSGWQELELDQLAWFWRDLGEKFGRLKALRTEVEAVMRNLGVEEGDYYWPGPKPYLTGEEDFLDDVLVMEGSSDAVGSSPVGEEHAHPLDRAVSGAAQARRDLVWMEDSDILQRALKPWVDVVGAGLQRLHRLPPMGRIERDALGDRFREMLADVQGLQFLELHLKEVGKRVTTLPGRGPIFVILAHEDWQGEIEAPDIVSQLKPESLCFLRAPDKESACKIYRKATGESRQIFAVTIGRWIKEEGIEADGRTYHRKARRNRIPTLEEHLSELEGDAGGGDGEA